MHGSCRRRCCLQERYPTQSERSAALAGCTEKTQVAHLVKQDPQPACMLMSEISLACTAEEVGCGQKNNANTPFLRNDCV